MDRTGYNRGGGSGRGRGGGGRGRGGRDRGAGGGGRGGRYQQNEGSDQSYGGGRGGGYQQNEGSDRGYGGRGEGYQQNEGSDWSYGGGRGRGRGSVNPAPAQAWGNRPAQLAQSGPEVSQTAGSTRPESSRGGIGRGAWGVPLTAKARGPASQKPAQSESEVQKVTESPLPGMISASHVDVLCLYTST